MKYCFDIDGTVCTNTDGEYHKAKPFIDVINRINLLYDAGNKIIFFTARGTTTGKDWSLLTKQQLDSWGVKYHELILNKPEADLFIDDKGVNIKDYMNDEIGDPKSIFDKEEYLDTTYTEFKAPKSSYPYKLIQYIKENYFKDPGSLLDIGCGFGEQLSAFKKHGYNPSGIDLSPSVLSLKDSFEVKVFDLENSNFPFPENHFDYIFSKSVIEHMHHPHFLFDHAYKTLKTNGKAVIMTPSWEHNKWGPFYIDHTHVTPFTRTSLEDLMIMSGFKNVKVFHFYQLPFVWKSPLLKIIPKIISMIPIKYSPYYKNSKLPIELNKLVRFSKEVMLFAFGEKL